jgi:nicotinamide mononucleotide adenylyltransferase
LSGLNDGEADLDETAPQAEGNGTEGYLRGVDGEAGTYKFPRHRLRTTMKGECIPDEADGVLMNQTSQRSLL